MSELFVWCKEVDELNHVHPEIPDCPGFRAATVEEVVEWLHLPKDADAPTTDREFYMIRQVREALGMFTGAMPASPSQVWMATLRELWRRLEPTVEAQDV